MPEEMGTERDIQTIETKGGLLISVPADKKVYLVEDLPLTPFGLDVTDLKAVAERKLRSVG